MNVMSFSLWKSGLVNEYENLLDESFIQFWDVQYN
jgi:hypothetical protein